MTTSGQAVAFGLMMAGAIAALAAIAPVAQKSDAAEPRRDLERVDAYAQTLFERSGLPGMALAVVDGGSTVYARGFGAAGDGGPSTTPDTLFIIGSTTKSMTALAVLQLAEQGKLRLDDPVAQYIPGFLRNDAAGRAMTLRTLLNQTSGLSHEAGDQPVLDAGDTGAAAIRNWAAALAPSALDRAPGASYEYSNANYVVLGAVIEIAARELYAQYMHEHVFAPLGMDHTYANLSDVPRDRLARGHKRFLNANVASEVPYPPAFVPVGFVISSVNDIARYLAAQLPGSANAAQLGISPQSLELWHKGVTPMDPDGKSHYAMGWAVDTFNGLPVVYHTGDTGTFASEFTMDLVNRHAVVLMTNGSHWLSAPYLQEISSGVVNILAGRTPRDDSGIHSLTWAILAVVLALPILQLMTLIVSFRTGRPRSMIGRIVVVGLHGAIAAALLYALPRMVFGIPLSELVISEPDMGFAALLSGVVAALALLLALRPTPRRAIA